MEKLGFQVGGGERQKILLGILIVLIFLFVLMMILGRVRSSSKISFSQSENFSPSQNSPPLPSSDFGQIPQIEKKVFEAVFNHPVFKKLQIPEKISPPLPEELGKENPFLPFTPTPTPSPTPTSLISSSEETPSLAPTPTPSIRLPIRIRR